MAAAMPCQVIISQNDVYKHRKPPSDYDATRAPYLVMTNTTQSIRTLLQAPFLHHVYTVYVMHMRTAPLLCWLLPVGLREGHEPYRHLATQAVTAFCDTGSPALAAAVPSLIRPLRLALQTYEPSLVGHALLLLQR